MKNYHILILFVCIFLASCMNEKDKMIHAVQAKEKELMSDSLKSIDRKKAIEMIDLYTQYAEKYPDDTNGYEYIFKAADISNGIGQYQQAINLYKEVSSNQAFRKRAVALFLQGFIYENQLRDYFKAREIYEKFLEFYPEHALADDVRYSLQNLGKTPEELIKEFEKKQQVSDSLSANS